MHTQELVNFYKGKFAEIQQEWLYQDKRGVIVTNEITTSIRDNENNEAG
jgi:hypothetical protein